MPKYTKRYTKRSYTKKRRVNKTKKLVTGQTQPTLLETIASGAGAVANVAKAVLPIVAAINTELKFYDAAFVAVPLFGTPTIQALNQIGQGTDEQNRIGNSILAKDINIRFQMLANFTTDQQNMIRMVIFVDKQQAGTAPTLAQLMQTTSNFQSSFNKDYTDRFAILKDKYFTMNANEKRVLQGKFYKTLPFHIRFLGSTTAAADLGNNTLYVLYWSAYAVNGPSISHYSRLNFTDN